MHFMDTSALAKRYLTEIGSTWIRALVPTTTIVISELSLVELSSVLARRVREGSLSSDRARILYDTFLLHVEFEYIVVNIERALLTQAAEFARILGLRTLDSVQLSAVMKVRIYLDPNVVFVAADAQLLAIAQSQGLRIDNLLNHP